MRFWKFSTSTLSLFNLTCLINSGYNLWMISMGVKTVNCCCDKLWYVFFLAGLRDQWMNTSLFIQFLIRLPSSFSLVGKIGLFFIIHFADSSYIIRRCCLLSNHQWPLISTKLVKVKCQPFPKSPHWFTLNSSHSCIYANIVPEFGTYWDLIHSRWAPTSFKWSYGAPKSRVFLTPVPHVEGHEQMGSTTASLQQLDTFGLSPVHPQFQTKITQRRQRFPWGVTLGLGGCF